jgi:hypothetical protein
MGLRVWVMAFQASPSVDPGGQWAVSVIRARRHIEPGLEDNTGLRPSVPTVMADDTPSVRKIVASTLAAYVEAPRIAIERPTDTPGQILGDGFPDAWDLIMPAGALSADGIL